MPRAITLIRSGSLADVAQYAYAATAPSNARLIFLAGACPLNEDGSTTGVREVFGDHDVPSTLLGVTVLGYRDQLVEIEAIAAVVD
jgi:enamine deaminase RidA (YjgF/YER057c/UK114 family)